MFTKEIEEELFELLQKIKEETVIVEGKRDKEVLCSFGFTKIFTINRGLYETAEKLEGKRVIILTDFDKEGKKIARKLNLFLQSLDCKIDRETRRKIGLMFARLKIKKIEELKSLR